jgi:hypothetical protein
MRSLISLIVILGLGPMIIFSNGCSIPPSSRVTQVTTLKALGATAAGVVTVSAQLYQQGQITAEQARQINDFFDRRFQPAYRLAVQAVNSDLNSLASPELIALAAQLSALLVSFQSLDIP